MHKPKLWNKYKVSNQILSLSVGLQATEYFAIDHQSLVSVVAQVDFRVFENMIKKINWYSSLGNQTTEVEAT